MIQLTKAFLKIFFRNRRAMFFVLLLPAAIFLITSYLGLEDIIRFQEGRIAYQEFLLAGIMAYALMSTGIYTVAYNLVDYHRTHILKRLFITPLSPAHFLLAQIVARFVIGLIQTGLLVVLGLALFNIKVQLNLILLPLIVFLGSTIFLGFGFLIAAMARDYEEAAPYTAVVGIGLTFLGDVFFPAANLPGWLPRLAAYLPLQPLSSLLRYSLVAAKPENLLQDAVVLLVWCSLLSVLASLVFAKKLRA